MDPQTRINAILGAVEARAVPQLAEHIARHTDLSIEQACGIMVIVARAVVPQPAPGSTPIIGSITLPSRRR